MKVGVEVLFVSIFRNIKRQRFPKKPFFGLTSLTIYGIVVVPRLMDRNRAIKSGFFYPSFFNVFIKSQECSTMKRLIEIKVVVLYAAILAGILFSFFQANPVVFADGLNETNATPILVDDFSWIHPYNNVSALNYYASDATGPQWDASGWQNPGDVAYHTNNLGFFVGSDCSLYLPSCQGIAQVEPGGYRSIIWDNSMHHWWWYSSTAIPEQNIWTDTSTDYYLSFRVRGKEGGERFAVRLDTNGYWSEKNIENYANITTQWQTVKIPLSEFYPCTNLNQTKSVALIFYGADGGSGTTIYFDDIVFLPEFDPVPEADGITKPQSQGQIQVAARRLYVNGAAHLIKGVGYSPSPIGTYPDVQFFAPFTAERCERDFPILEDMGVNTIRTWSVVGEFRNTIDTTLMDHAATYGMKVCAGFWIPYEISFLNDWALGHLRQDFQAYVTAFKDYAVLLMWVLSNENNWQNGYDWRYYNYLNTLAQDALAIEGPAYHPVAFVEADLGTIGDVGLGADDAHLNYVDIIGINAYRGKQFFGLFEQYAALTQKPIWISEFGVDAWHTYDPLNPSYGVENQDEQADYAVNDFIDAVRNSFQGPTGLFGSDTCIGTSVMAYSDEWWKDIFSPGASVNAHDFGGFFIPSFPDGVSNEEWWGMVSVAQAPDEGEDLVFRRSASYALYSTTIGGKINLNKYPRAQYVKIIGPSGTQTKVFDGNGLYYFSQLLPGTYKVQLVLSCLVPYPDPRRMLEAEIHPCYRCTDTKTAVQTTSKKLDYVHVYPCQKVITQQVTVQEDQTKVVDFN